MSRSGRARRVGSLILASVLAVAALLFTRPDTPTITSEELTLTGGPRSAQDSSPQTLDATIYLPERVPAPAVILAHGFGGSKTSLTDQAQVLARAGYVVLAYSARGFGQSLGQISMNSPEFEIADARALIDYLATRDDVVADSTGDPRVAVAGASYGGALALMTAGYDARVDAIAADITWHDLSSALFPQNADVDDVGVFKQMWSGTFFSVGLITPMGTVDACGRFAPQWCAAYTEVASGDQPSEATLALMRASSPSSVAAQIVAPTLLLAGQADSLFPLSEADATARAIAASNPETPLKLVWHGGGHDGGLNERTRLNALIVEWLDAYLQPDGTPADTRFEVTLGSGSIISSDSDEGPTVFGMATYPGLTGTQSQQVSLAGPPQRILAPAGGSPATFSVLPGLGSAAGLLGQSLPGQAAVFTSEPFTTPTTLLGHSTLQLQISADLPVTDVALFASVRVVSSAGTSVLPQGLVAPLRLASVGPEPTTVTVTLPAIATEIGTGDSLHVVVSTTDAGYRLPDRPAVYTIAVADSALTIPTAILTPVTAPTSPWAWLLGAVIVSGLILVVVILRRPRRHAADHREDLADVPLSVEKLGKAYASGLRAVDGVSFQLPRGEVIGLLGPNGAGKTTTMRMVMGLIQPTDGDVFVFGERVTPGAAVLARVGALVEGAGFLPHLSGRANLESYWAASGRTDVDPQFEEVLRIADLGTAVDRPVRTYSQGMRQRLGIAQAMLGMPDLLMLDEPTNGLDPPQIKAMRQVMQSYAATGRTVIVSSHLLSEVEQTCSFVVVMHRGRLITTGRVTDLLAGRSGMRLEDFFLEVVGDDLTIGKA